MKHQFRQMDRKRKFSAAKNPSLSLFLFFSLSLSLYLSFSLSLSLSLSLFFLKHNLNTWVVKWRDVFSACKWRSYTFTTNRRWNDFNHFLTILIWILLSTLASGIAFLSPIRIWGFLIVCGRKYQQLSILKFRGV